MNVILSKIKTYIGFATKSNSIKFGTDNIVNAKHSKIILVSDEIVENSYQKIIIFAKKYGIEVEKLSSEVFSSLINKEGVKVISITNENLADAIKNCLADFSRGGKLE